jgi:hypothetical protein
MAGHCASKAAAHSATQALRAEARDRGIEVIGAYPGRHRHRHAGRRRGGQGRSRGRGPAHPRRDCGRSPVLTSATQNRTRVSYDERVYWHPDHVPAGAPPLCRSPSILGQRRSLRCSSDEEDGGAGTRRSGCGLANGSANETLRDGGDAAEGRRQPAGLVGRSARRTGTPETPKTGVVCLITQRSRVQIPPPLPRSSRSEA